MFTVKLGELAFSGTDPDGVLWAVETVDGWGGTASTASQTQRPRQSGAWSGDKFAKARDVTVEGTFRAPTPDLAQAAADQLHAAVGRQEVPLYVAEAGPARWASVYQTGETLVTWESEYEATWSFQVASDDWRKFGEELTATTALPSTTGGLVIGTTSHEWVGAVDESPSVRRTDGGVPTSNLIADPRGVSPRWWSTPGATAAAVPAGMQLTPNGSATAYIYAAPHVSVVSDSANRFAIRPGQSLAFATTVTNTSAATVWIALGAAFYDSAGAGGAANSSLTLRAPLAPGEVRRVELLATLPADSTRATGMLPLLYVYGTSGGGIAPATATVAAREWILQIADRPFTSAPSYFDGSMPAYGGLTVPYVIPAVTATGQVSLTNRGNEPGPVRLRIDGPCVGPVVTHVSTGAQLVFASSLVLRAGEWLDVDMENRTVLANGQASRNGWITSRGWSAFDPGANSWAFTATTYNPAARLTVSAVPSWK